MIWFQFLFGEDEMMMQLGIWIFSSLAYLFILLINYLFFNSNILYCFDTNTHLWSKPKVYGNIPGARDGHSACVINNCMWIFGGYEEEVKYWSNEIDFDCGHKICIFYRLISSLKMFTCWISAPLSGVTSKQKYIHVWNMDKSNTFY